MASFGCPWLVSDAGMRSITEVKSVGSVTDPDAPVLLALTPDRFRGDLQILADSGRFRVLKFDQSFQQRVLSYFWPSDFTFDPEIYCGLKLDPAIAEMQSKLRRFVRRLLSEIYTDLNVDCLIGPSTWYRQDYEWGLVSAEMGVPYVVLHLENLITGQGHFNSRVDYAKKWGKFKGTHIVVHNERSRDAFITSGIVDSRDISALGCLRMDEYVQRIKQIDSDVDVIVPKPRKKVVLFSFQRGVMLPGVAKLWPENRSEGFPVLFKEVHLALAELAIENPSVDFVIKTKWSGVWMDEINLVLSGCGIDSTKVDNLLITADGNAQDLILDSDVVSGFGSTTLIEGGIAGKPIVFPNFAEALKPEYRDYIEFGDELQLFDVAGSKDEFKDIIIRRLKYSEIEPKCMELRYDSFERHVSSMEADSLDKYGNLLLKLINTEKK